ncbi:MAG: stage II sporulation protein M [Candidatus Aenigmarchaeota archaeon]|nr:stage II sporulation protein M [Candidatus Aenigmarchaeota archaeon]
MVLEKLVPVRFALKNPWVMFVNGIVISLTCLFISFFVFESSVGLVTTLLITIAMMPFMLNLTIYHEAREEEIIAARTEPNLIRRHGDILKVYTAFFLGMILSFSLAYLLLPEAISYKLFRDQIDTINAIRGGATFASTFERILTNNIGVLLLSFFFSFLFGAGAIFILSWNASVLSVAIGSLAKTIGGIRALPIAVLPFLPHGSLEILAYFIGGISGGLISAAITRRASKQFWPVVRDSLGLLVISVLLLVVAAIIETIEIMM